MEGPIPFSSTISDSEDETNDSCIIYMIYLSVLLVLSVLTVVLTCWWTTKFFLLFKTRKKLTTIFLFVLTLSSVARLAYFITEIIWRQGECSISVSRCGEEPIYWLSATLFSSAIVINIFNWIYQTLRMKKFITGVRQKQVVHHVLFACFSGLVLLAYFMFLLGVCVFDEGDSVVGRIFTLFYGITFFFIAVVFIFVGWKFYKEYKKFFEDRAKKIKCKIILSITVISSTFAMKGLVNIAYFWGDLNSRFRSEWLRTNTLWYPLLLFFYFTITEIFPTIFLCMGVRSISHQLKKQNEEDNKCNLAITNTSNGTLAESLNSVSNISVARDISRSAP
ncbi:unnamed protein product [Moneuplotes crassus]|uniref:Uncharacterized protein n=1 Tax=Euplotes crassus TaxID=5936 RepID=A0AAD1XDT9_EUPCR|nr:unnamed protein product [Moneuplotes crassus]